jgi:predicted nucleic acid-binding protein
MSGIPDLGLGPGDASDPSLAPGPSEAPTSVVLPPMSYVVDTSIALKWYIPEVGSAEARLYMGPGIDRHAPDLLPLEGAHALLKRTRSGDPVARLAMGDALMVAEALRDGAPIRYHSCWPLLAPALSLAAEIGASVYDGLFLALAIRQGNRVVTADGKFRDKIESSGYASHVRWFMDPP